MSAEIVVLRAATPADLAAEAAKVAGYLDRFPDASLLDVAATCAGTQGDEALAVVAESVRDLRSRLESARTRIEAGAKRIRDKSGTYYFAERLLGPGGGRLAFVYPSAMSFYPDMLKDLAVRRPECRSAFDELEEALSRNGGGFTPSNFIFPPAPHYRRDAEIFSAGAYAQSLVATYAGCVALSRMLSECGLAPDGAVGFGGGDLAAMALSGAMGAAPSRQDRMKIVSDIYSIVDKAVDHAGLPETAMFTLLLRHEGEADAVLASFPEGKATVAIDFSPRQKTLAVEKGFEAEALAAFAAAGIRAMKLSIDRPFNTASCEMLVPAIRKFADRWVRHDPRCTVYSCATAEPLPGRLRRVREDIAGRWAKPVRFRETVRRMYDDGYRVFVEVGPRGLMMAAVEDTLRGEPHAAIPLDSMHRRDGAQLRHAVAHLSALGAKVDMAAEYARRGAKTLDFSSALAPSARRESEMRLSRAFPRLTLTSVAEPLGAASMMADPKGRGAKAAARAAAVAAAERRRRQFDFGAMNPLLSDADTVAASPGVSVEMRKTFKVSEDPFIGDFALGTSQLSYSDPNLRGLVLLDMPVAAEIMAEAALTLVPNRVLVAIEDLTNRRSVAFEDGALTLFVRAERVSSGDPSLAAVKVQLRDDSPNSAYTWPITEATFVLARDIGGRRPMSAEPLTRPRSVHWSGRDIYPARICRGRRLRGVSFVDAWSESGLDYEVVVPQLAGTVSHTRFPMWAVDPLLMGTVVSGFALWRSHERFAGAYSFPFKMRRIEFHAPPPAEGAKLRCYLRLAGVTPRSQICDISVSDGNGSSVMQISGWEELVERVNAEYRDLVMQPAMTFLTKPLAEDAFGAPGVDISSAFVADVPYPFFERDEEIWLKTFSHIVLSGAERRQFKAMSGSVARRTEWLFGRIAAKEAVRRFLRDYHQARWSDADVTIFADDMGKPYAIGAWSDYLSPARIDIAIAHTSQFVTAAAAANARIGIDVESSSRVLSEEFAAGVFAPEETELAARAANVSQAMIRFWCAKEAVSKALGTGIRYSPVELAVRDYDAETGRLRLRLEGAWAETFRNLRGRDIPVATRIMHDHVLASCILPDALFKEP